MSKLRIGVVRGGISIEYPVSLKTGAAILRALRERLSHKYEPIDILIDTEGTWYKDGLPMKTTDLDMDMIINALHGTYGEDGGVEADLIPHNVPTSTHLSQIGDALVDKEKAKSHFEMFGLNALPHTIVRRELAESNSQYILEIARSIFTSYSPPWVIKPLSGGASIGVTLARTFEELVQAITHGFESHPDLIVEPYLRGTHVVVGVIPDFRTKEYYVTSPLVLGIGADVLSEEKRSKGEYQTYGAHVLEASEKDLIEQAALTVAHHFSLSHHAMIDMIVTSKGITVLDVDTVPALDEASPFVRLLDSIGSSVDQIVDHVIERNMNK